MQNAAEDRTSAHPDDRSDVSGAPLRSGRVKTAIFSMLSAIGVAGHTPDIAIGVKPAATSSAEPSRGGEAVSIVTSNNAHAIAQTLTQDTAPTCVEPNEYDTPVQLATQTTTNVREETPETTDTFWNQGDLPIGEQRVIVVDNAAHTIQVVGGKTIVIDGKEFNCYLRNLGITINSLKTERDTMVLSGASALGGGTTTLTKSEFSTIVTILLNGESASIPLTSSFGITFTGEIKPSQK